MKAWRKFVDTLELTKDLEQDYFDMREIFQREGWSEEDLKSPPYLPQDLLDYTLHLHLKYWRLYKQLEIMVSMLIKVRCITILQKNLVI
jgi:hypothetical protein